MKRLIVGGAAVAAAVLCGTGAMAQSAPAAE